MKGKSTIDLSGLERFHKEVNELSSQKLEYGYFDEPHYSGLNLATLAAIHEEGWNNLPARNFILSTYVAFQKDLAKMNKQLFSDIASGKGYYRALKNIGDSGARKIQFVIDTGSFSNNKVSASWADIKGFSEALRHYGDLRDGATYRISKKKD